MRKNLTVSLSQEDWQKLQAMVSLLGETYSRVFHRLIESGAGAACDQKRVDKYRTLLAPHAAFLAGRAALFAKARKRKQVSA